MNDKTATGPTVGAVGPALNLYVYANVIQLRASAVAHEQADAKQLTNLLARFALAGFQLHVMHLRGGVTYYEVRRWNEVRRFRDLNDVGSFATQVGAL